jgi:hypothetical protein
MIYIKFMINHIKYSNYNQYINSNFINKNKIPENTITREDGNYIKALSFLSNKLEKFTFPDNPNQYREGIILAKSEAMNIRRLSLLHLVTLEQNLEKNLYITEQVTECYKYFKRYFKKIVGSEFIDENIHSGKIIDGVMHQNIENLSFKNNQFDIIVCSEVLEHVSNYLKSLKQFLRCLNYGGSCYMTFPFIIDLKKNIIRAYKNDYGELVHLLPAEYHGDTIRSKGILCYRHFGWEIIDQAKKIGFSDVLVYHIYDPKYCYIAEDLVIFKFVK